MLKDYLTPHLAIISLLVLHSLPSFWFSYTLGNKGGEWVWSLLNVQTRGGSKEKEGEENRKRLSVARKDVIYSSFHRETLESTNN